MDLNERIDALVKLGEYIRQKGETLQSVIHHAYLKNKWFTEENINIALDAIVEHFLDANRLVDWVEQYDMNNRIEPRRIGLILAGNIPMVGFHDLLCVFVAGDTAKIKLSEKDSTLIPFLLNKLNELDERAASRFEIVDRLTDFDAVIATGSNNSARYFESYFGKFPHIIRKNRNAVAILSGSETQTDLQSLGVDVFQYFGLGCRNVSKLYVPHDYNFEPLLEALHEHNQLVLHNKYKNNFDYNYTLVILNKTPYQANGCVILTEEETIASRIAGLHFEYYSDEKELVNKLRNKQEDIQCIITREKLEDLPTIPFGKAQQPSLSDYADGVDVMNFLLKGE